MPCKVNVARKKGERKFHKVIEKSRTLRYTIETLQKLNNNAVFGRYYR